MSFEQLIEVVAPPDNPFEAGTPSQWGEVENLLGTSLPEDYKKFINSFGSGGFTAFCPY